MKTDFHDEVVWIVNFQFCIITSCLDMGYGNTVSSARSPFISIHLPTVSIIAFFPRYGDPKLCSIDVEHTATWKVDPASSFWHMAVENPVDWFKRHDISSHSYTTWSQMMST